MIRNRILLKTFAVFFIIEIISSIVAPVVSWALTAGPTAPEATSFEPVDTTDMVNTITGDFVYNIPLLEVPGPAGGYPLSLSYHGGVLNDVEASWVGLNWTLNSGSINRMVSNVPDDFHNLSTETRSFWQGGQTSINTYGVSVGIGSYASVGAGLSFAHDTYKGRGVGGYVGASAQLGGENSPVSVGIQIGVSPYGGGTSVGLSVGIAGSVGEGFNTGLNAGMTFNAGGKVDAGLSGDFSFASQQKTHGALLQSSTLGASISTGDTKGSLTVGGASSSGNNSRAGIMSSYTSNMSVDIPVWYGVNIHIGQYYRRYWVDETEKLTNNGSLYFPKDKTESSSSSLYDTYNVEGLNSVSDGSPPQKYMEGTFADYDQYSVNAQGVAGSFRPYHYLLSVSSQDISHANNSDILNYPIPQHATGLGFRFIGDFSNNVLNNPDPIEINKKVQDYSNPSTSGRQSTDPGYSDWIENLTEAYTSTETIPLSFPYGNPKTSASTQDENLRKIPNLPGTKHIEYFTVYDIINPSKIQSSYERGFIDCNAPGFKRPVWTGSDFAAGSKNDGLGNSIGAFTVTNPSGVSYHFSLPAYSLNESTYSGKFDSQGKLSCNVSNQANPYAYTWFLTSITGPDYVDRGPDGNPDHVINEFDWGYWVDFQYGKWTDSYKWRNPGSGFNDDLDNNFQTFSMGEKQVYYLNAIKTKTHTALFIKEIRADGKSGVAQYDHPFAYGDNNKMVVDDGLFHPVLKVQMFEDQFGNETIPGQIYFEFPRSTLRLKTIELFKNEDLNDELSSYYNLGNHYNHLFVYDDGSGMRPYKESVHTGANILDVFDADSNDFPDSKAIRKIEFDFDYSLSPNTINSYDEDGNIYNCPTSPLVQGNCLGYEPGKSYYSTNLGRLTLKALTFKGKGGNDAIPPMKFSYDYSDNVTFGGDVTSLDAVSKTIQVSLQDNSLFSMGDIVQFSQNGAMYYGFVDNIASSISIKIISDSLPQIAGVTGLRKTKNPPYNKDFYDMWGYYKVDYQPTGTHNLRRFPTKISAANADVWSLREIQSSIGSTIKIDYEPDTYYRSVFGKNLGLNLSRSSNETDVTPASSPEDYSGKYKFFIEASVSAGSQIKLDDLYEVGDYAEILAMITSADNSATGYYTPSPEIITGGVVQEVSPTYVRFRVHSGHDLLGGYYGGILQLGARDKNYGGGMRVSSIGISDPISTQTEYTTYQYEFDGLSSGVTTYEPLNINALSFGSDISSVYADAFNQQIYQPFIKILSLSRDMPAPAIYYGKVRMSEKIVKNDGSVTQFPNYTEYEFETFSEGMLDYVTGNYDHQNSSGQFNGQNYSGITTRSVALRDYTSRLGNLKSIALFDINGHKINETRNQYLHEEQTRQDFYTNTREYDQLLTRFNSQGVIQETFNNARWVKNTYSNELQGLISTRSYYPTIITGSTTINYKTGITTESKNLMYDFYSGQLIKQSFSDGYGNTFVSESKPAYNVYPDMGLIADGGANMLIQEAANYTYKINPVNNNKIGLVAASVQTWSDQSQVLRPRQSLSPIEKQTGIWRKKASYSFVGDDSVPLPADGLYPIANLLPVFASWDGTTDAGAGWQKNGEITLYDVQSHALEVSDLNGNYAATKMTPDQIRVTATIANSEYGDFSYTGAEDEVQEGDMGNQFKLGTDARVVPGNPHTGVNSVKTDFEGVIYENDITPNKKYTFSFWASSPDAVQIKWMVNGQPTTLIPSSIRQAGNWYQYNVSIFPKSAHLKIWCQRTVEGPTGDVYFDDFRIFPTAASMVSYVYNEWGELSHILDYNNMFTEYHYDGMGRLTDTYRETFENNLGVSGKTKLATVEYNYGLNHPYVISVNATTTGGPGQLLPAGTTQAAQGDDITFNIVETCSNPKFNGLYIDAQQIDLGAASPIILADGTQLIVSDKVFMLKNIQSAHTISANFYKAGVLGTVECVGYPNTDGTVCYDGSYRYAYFDACGNVGGWTYVSEYSKIPANLRQLAGNCCGTTSQSSGVTKTSNSSTSCTCVSTYTTLD